MENNLVVLSNVCPDLCFLKPGCDIEEFSIPPQLCSTSEAWCRLEIITSACVCASVHASNKSTPTFIAVSLQPDVHKGCAPSDIAPDLLVQLPIDRRSFVRIVCNVLAGVSVKEAAVLLRFSMDAASVRHE